MTRTINTNAYPQAFRPTIVLRVEAFLDGVSGAFNQIEDHVNYINNLPYVRAVEVTGERIEREYTESGYVDKSSFGNKAIAELTALVSVWNEASGDKGVSWPVLEEARNKAMRAMCEFLEQTNV